MTGNESKVVNSFMSASSLPLIVADGLSSSQLVTMLVGLTNTSLGTGLSSRFKQRERNLLKSK